MNRFALAAFLSLIVAPAFACPSPLTGKDASGTTQNFGVTLDGSANCYGNIAIVDGSNAANKATVTSGNALKVDGSAVTQPVSGTVTANQGSPPWSVSQSGTWTARVVGNAGGIFDFAGQNAAQPGNSILIGGEFNTTPTTITSGNASPLQLDSAGNLLVNVKANSFGTITVSGTVTANQGTSPWIENVSQFGGSAVVTGTGAGGAGIPRVTVSNDSNILATQSGTWTVQQGSPPWTIQGDSASGGSNAGNPVKAGGVFNTTQPTVTTGETVDAQYTARGAAIVATGVDVFTVTANAGSGTFTVSGTVTANQGTSPWVDNITQFGGTNLSTGTGASGVGIPRVTVSNDSNILATQSGTWTVQQGSPPWQDNITQIAGNAVSTATTGVMKVGIVGNAGGAMDAAGQNASSPANELLVAGQFNTTPTTITSGNISPLQMDSAGNLLVNVKVGGGTGGTSSSFGAAFPGTGTAIGVKNGSNMVNLNADGSGNLDVNCVVGCGASGFADLGAFTLGSSNINNVGGVYETGPAPVASGQAAAVQITGNRALQAARYDSAGRELGSALPGRSNVAELFALQQTFSYSQTLFQPFDALGRSNTSSMITDGQHYASLTPPNIAATAAQTGVVVSISPNSTATVAGTVTANAGSGTFTVGGTVTAAQSTAANLNATVVGTGTFAVQAAQSGTWTVQQGTPPWQDNITQFGGNAVVTGTGASGSGIPRVTVSNDSNILATQSGSWTVAATESGTWTVQPGNTANTTPWLVSISQGGNTAAVNASSQLSVNCANCSGSGVSQQDLTGFTFGTTNMVPIGGVYSTATSNVASGQAAAARITANRAVQMNINDSAGRELGASVGAGFSPPIQINQAQTLTQYNRTVVQTPTDSLGSQRVAAMIYDGQHYANVLSGNKSPSAGDSTLEVTPSIVPVLQCPFTVGISQTANTQIVTNPGGKSLHVCLFTVIASAAMNVSLVEGTGTTCGTNPIGLWGSGAAASVPLAANGGAALTSDRIIIPMQKLGDNLCVLSGTGTVAGTLTYGVF